MIFTKKFSGTVVFCDRQRSRNNRKNKNTVVISASVFAYVKAWGPQLLSTYV